MSGRPRQGRACPNPGDRGAQRRSSQSCPDFSQLRLAATVAAYELAQRHRIGTGELIRSLLQARFRDSADGEVPETDADAILRAIRAGTAEGPIPMAGELYAKEWAIERGCLKAMAGLVETHPVWPWLDRVRGVGPTLSARLLARLRIERAANPSSFWQFCGLGTVEGQRFRCSTCGSAVTAPRDRAPPRLHYDAAGKRCVGELQDEGEHSVRVAMRFPLHGQRRSFDVNARTLCHLVGTSFLRRKGRYSEVYYRQRERLLVRTPPLRPIHAHLAAMRVMEKLFLANLWTVWAERLELPSRLPYQVAKHGRAGTHISPWEMVED